jgi:L-threonylcarbamoyladenylate synthase
MVNTRLGTPAELLRAAVDLLSAGELVAFPTETVYGLGADARQAEAIAKIYEAKGRPSGNPVIVHVAGVTAARECVSAWPDVAERLAARFWPGPLTLILPRGKAIAEAVSAGRQTVAVRSPKHPVAESLLNAFGGPIAAPSANRSGFTSPTTAAHVMAELAGRVPLIIDGGTSEVGLESTVVDLSIGVPTILRPGAITLEMLQEIIPGVQLRQVTVKMSESAASPGLHDRHYAPRTRAYRFERGDWERTKRWAEANGPLALVSCTDEVSLPAPHETILLPDDAAGYARNLYAALREADEKKMKAILVLLPEDHGGLWTAVIDRLRRATLVLT